MRAISMIQAGVVVFMGILAARLVDDL